RLCHAAWEDGRRELSARTSHRQPGECTRTAQRKVQIGHEGPPVRIIRGLPQGIGQLHSRRLRVLMANPFLVIGGIAVGVATAAFGILSVPGWISAAQDAAAINDMSNIRIAQAKLLSQNGEYAD